MNAVIHAGSNTGRQTYIYTSKHAGRQSYRETSRHYLALWSGIGKRLVWSV